MEERLCITDNKLVYYHYEHIPLMIDVLASASPHNPDTTQEYSPGTSTDNILDVSDSGSPSRDHLYVKGPVPELGVQRMVMLGCSIASSPILISGPGTSILLSSTIGKAAIVFSQL